VHEQHARIVEAIEAADESGAEAEMVSHLEFLVPFYEKAWRDQTRGA
jgi:DNA-binding GntR family transcriptional regulator